MRIMKQSHPQCIQHLLHHEFAAFMKCAIPHKLTLVLTIYNIYDKLSIDRSYLLYLADIIDLENDEDLKVAFLKKKTENNCWGISRVSSFLRVL